MDPKGGDQSSVWGRRISIKVYVLRVLRIKNNLLFSAERVLWTPICTQPCKNVHRSWNTAQAQVHLTQVRSGRRLRSHACACNHFNYFLIP